MSKPEVEEDRVIALDGTDITVVLAEAASYEAIRDKANAEFDARCEKIRTMLGENTVGTVGGKPVVTNRWRNRTNVDSKALKAIDESLWEKVTNVTRYRVLDRFPGKRRKRAS